MHKARKCKNLFILSLTFAILLIYVSGCEKQTADNKALFDRMIQECWNQGNIEMVDEICAPNFVYHAPGSPDIVGPDDFKQFIEVYLTAFPDAYFTIEDQIAEKDKVATRWSFTATHKGELAGIAPTGLSVAVTGTTISRFSNGKLAETWDVFDALGMWQKLGIVPPIGEGE